MKQTKSNLGSVLSTILVIAWILLALIDMWLDVVSLGVFIKITISVFVILLLLAVLGFLRTDKE